MSSSFDVSDNTTMAHEADVVLHRYLFEPGLAQLMPVGAGTPVRQRTGLMGCLTRDVAPVNDKNWEQVRRKPDWREVQANRGMAALLMPSRTFKRVAGHRIAELGLSMVSAGTLEAAKLASAMSEVFKVSKQAATIRMETLEIVTIS